MYYPILVSHRSYTAHEGEEDLNFDIPLAFRLSVLYPNNIIEVDVGQCANNLVYFPSESMKRLDDKNLNYMEMELEELNKIDSRIFPFENILEWRLVSEKPLMINLKDESCLYGVLELLKKYNRKRDILIGYSDDVGDALSEIERLKKLGELEPSIKTALLFRDHPTYNNLEEAIKVGSNIIGMSYKNVGDATNEIIEEAKKNGLKLAVWSLKNEESLKWGIEREIDYLLVDDPAWAIEILYQ